jgi:hypothetical protein
MSGIKDVPSAGHETGRFSSVLYAVIWLFGAIGAAYYFIPTLDHFSVQMHDTLASASIGFPLEWVRYFLSAIIAATFVHISLVYLSMHEMDLHPGDWRSEFPNWANSITEYCVRFFILMALFSIADKIWPVLQKLIGMYAGTPHAAGKAVSDAAIPCVAEPLYVFPLSCAGLFFVLLLWDLLGVWRKDGRQRRLAEFPKELILLMFKMNSDARAAFFRSDVFGFLFWMFMTAYVLKAVYPWEVIPFLLISPVSYILNNGWRAFRFVFLDGWRIVVPTQAAGNSK